MIRPGLKDARDEWEVAELVAAHRAAQRPQRPRPNGSADAGKGDEPQKPYTLLQDWSVNEHTPKGSK